MIVLLFSLAVPFACSFYPPLRFYRNIKALLLSLVIVTFVFGVWDVFATARKHWYFEPDYVFSARLINLPYEEVLFFPVVTFCCIFTWEALSYLTSKKR